MNSLDKLEQLYMDHRCPDCVHVKHCSIRTKGPCKSWMSLNDWVDSAVNTLNELAENEIR